MKLNPPTDVEVRKGDRLKGCPEENLDSNLTRKERSLIKENERKGHWRVTVERDEKEKASGKIHSLRRTIYKQEQTGKGFTR